MNRIDLSSISIQKHRTGSIGFGLMVLSCANCTLCNMLGVNLALRGPKGSMAVAVNELAAERNIMYYTFGIGLICFHITAIIYAIQMLHTGSALSLIHI